MVRAVWTRFGMAVVLLTAMSCGGGNPAGPPSSSNTSTTPTPVAAATATPRPTAACTQGLCEAPTTNTNPPARIFVKVFQVLKPNGDVAPCGENDPAAPGGPAPFTFYGFAAIPVGYRVVLDATAFDAANKPTNADCDKNEHCINWRQEDGADLIGGYSEGHIFQPKFNAIGEGDFQIQAEMLNNGSRVRSPWFWLKFVERESQSPCGGPSR